MVKPAAWQMVGSRSDESLICIKDYAAAECPRRATVSHVDCVELKSESRPSLTELFWGDCCPSWAK